MSQLCCKHTATGWLTRTFGDDSGQSRATAYLSLSPVILRSEEVTDEAGEEAPDNNSGGRSEELTDETGEEAPDNKSGGSSSSGVS